MAEDQSLEEACLDQSIIGPSKSAIVSGSSVHRSVRVVKWRQGAKFIAIVDDDGSVQSHSRTWWKRMGFWLEALDQRKNSSNPVCSESADAWREGAAEFLVNRSTIRSYSAGFAPHSICEQPTGDTGKRAA